MAESAGADSALNLRPDAHLRVGDLNQPGALVEDRPGCDCCRSSELIALPSPPRTQMRAPSCPCPDRHSRCPGAAPDQPAALRIPCGGPAHQCVRDRAAMLLRA